MNPSAQFRELVRYVEGDLTQLEAQKLERELQASAPLRQELERVRQYISDIGSTPPDLGEVDLLAGVDAQLAKPKMSQAPRWRHVVGALAIGAAASLLVVVAWRPRDGEFRIKGTAPVEAAKWAGIEAYQVTRKGETQRIGHSVGAEDGLAFAYRNGGEQPFTHLMIFGIDAKGDVHWFFPEWRDAATNPESIRIAGSKNAVELREVLRHEIPLGTLKVHGVFTHRPLTVKDVEAKLRASGPLENVTDHVLTFEVHP